MNRVLKLKAQFDKYPFGRKLFSIVVARMAPYFSTIKPTIVELKPNYIKVSMRKRKAVHNHLKTVHAIAMCNLCEFAAGICMEASLPKHLRWIPVGMQVSYLAKAKTDLYAVCDLGEPQWANISSQLCEVSVRDKSHMEVVKAVIEMKVSERPSN